MRRIIAGATVAGVLMGCSPEDGGSSGQESNIFFDFQTTPQQSPYNDGIFNDDYIDTGHVWVDTSKGGHCSVNMAHAVENGRIVDVVGSTDGTPCDLGTHILTETPEDYEEQLAELRNDWDEFIEEVGREIIDGENEGFVDSSVMHMWVNRIGSVAINDSDVTVNLSGNHSDSYYGPDSCSIEGSQAVRVLGKASLDDKTYGIGMLLNGWPYGAPCRKGDVILLNVDALENVFDESPAEPMSSESA